MYDVVAAGSPEDAVLAVALASSADPAAAFSGLLWLGVVALSVMVLVVTCASIRRRFRDRGAAAVPPFSLDQLRRMKEAGRVTPAEYESLRRRAVEGLGAG